MSWHYTLLATEHIPEHDADCRYYVHRQSGAHILHLHNADPENLFAFCFATPPSDSTGVAHILEHTVLCGSRRFPLKDPFLQLLKGSVHSFLNAMTFPDRTVYPAASALAADLFNMMQVYGDAVFSPRLQREMFMQEGHHIIINEQGKLEISGVVYNEMVGASATHDHVTNEWSYRGLMPDTIYGHSSGGEPQEIPHLDHETLVSFHRAHYHPSQSLIFLYGNIATGRYLRFLHTRFLRHFTMPPAVRAARRAGTLLPPIDVQVSWDAPRTLVKTFPYPAADVANKSSVTISWLLDEVHSGYDILVAEIVSEILIGNSGCPLYKAILDSPLGEDLSSASGVESELKQLVFSVGIRGTEEQHSASIRSLIYDTLRDIVANGIDPVLVRGALFKIEFSLREIKSLQGLRVLRRVMSGWLYNSDPFSTLSVERALGAFKVNLTRNARLVEEFIQQRLLDNAHHLVLVVKPDAQQAERERAILQQQLADRAAAMSVAERRRVVAANEEMQRLQQATEDERTLSLIPRVGVRDMLKKVRVIDYRVRRATDSDLSVLHIPQHSNDIAYAIYAIDISHLSPQELGYVPLLTTAITEMGTRSHDYVQLSQLINRHCGGLHVSAELHTDINDDQRLRLSLVVQVKTLFRELPDALRVLTELLIETDFSHHNRYTQILTEDVNEMKSAIIPSAHIFSGRSATAAINPIGDIQERWSGVSQLKFLSAIASPQHRRTLQHIYRHIMAGGIYLAAVSAPESRLETLHSSVEAMNRALAAEFAAPQKSATPQSTVAAAAASAALPSSYTIPSGGNYVAYALPATRLTADTITSYVAESVLARALSTGVLWEQIRMQGGAYGASASVGLTPGALCFISYRDPHVARTISEFQKALDYAAAGKITAEEIGRTIVSITGTENTPLPPGHKVRSTLMRHIGGYTDQLRQSVYHAYLTCPRSAVVAAARRFCDARSSRSVAVIGEADKIAEARAQHTDMVGAAEPLML